MRAYQWMFLAALIVIQPLLPFQTAGAGTDAFEGYLRILRSDNFTTGVTTTTYYLESLPDGNGQRYSLRFSGELPDTPLRTGDMVAVEGTLMDGTITVQSLVPLIAQQRSDETVSAFGMMEAPAIEDRRAVILIVSFKDAANSLSVADVAGFMYTNTQNVDDLYKASSFQQLGFNPDTDGNGSPDVFGPFTIDYDKNSGCRPDDWADAADTAARNAGVDLSRYQHKVYALPSEAACGWSGLGSVGCSSYYCSVWVRGGGGPVFAHELGHNLGWYHASTDPENDGRINSEYGDRSGVMGYPNWSQVNAPHRDQLQWFNAFPGSLQVAQTSGTFELHALELDPGAASVGTQVIKVRKADSNEYYYISYRRRIGNYPVTSDYADKINIHRKGGSNSNSAHLTNLEQGQIFSDNANNITITANTTGGTTASVTVTIGGAPANNAPTASFNYSVGDLNVQFTDASGDSDGTIAGRLWNFGDGNSSTQTNPRHTFAAPGTYNVRLMVTDDDGATGTMTRSVVTNMPPTANFEMAVNGLQVTFSQLCSDSDGTIQSYTWDFGDGNGSTDPNPVHTYTSYGTYTVTLTVQDNDGASVSSSDDVDLVEVEINSNSSAPASNIASGGGGGSSSGCFIQSVIKR